MKNGKRVTLTADEFKELQAKAQMSNAETSRVLMISQTTILKWRKSGGEIPLEIFEELKRLSEDTCVGN